MFRKALLSNKFHVLCIDHVKIDFQVMNYFTTLKNNNEEETVKIKNINCNSLPDEPTTCCMSGCANCVWIQYAEELTKIFKDGKMSQEIILKKVSDPNMQAFLMTELRALDKLKENK
uniref:Oxidoreductase-like domain-containing protein n=1 Tax=Clastoptera arizonana TaxID=38151 RepID=A0A1B6DN76_9HEMI